MSFPSTNKTHKFNCKTAVEIIDAVLKEGSFTENGEHDAKDIGADGYSKVNINVQPKLQKKTVSENGPVSADDGYDALETVNVDVQPKLQSKTAIKNGPVTHDAGYDGLAGVDVNIPWETDFWIGVLFKGDVYGGRNAGSITLPNGLTQIPANAYAYNNELKHITIPEGVKLIKEGAFQNCKNLETVTFPYGVEEIEGDVFINCSKLGTVHLSNTIKSIGGSSFAYCNNLYLVYLPASLENISSYAFYQCKSILGNLPKIPESVKNIGNYAFGDCSQFIEVTFKGKPDYISPTAFSGCNLNRIYVPWAEGEVANAPWGSQCAIYYNW